MSSRLSLPALLAIAVVSHGAPNLTATVGSQRAKHVSAKAASGARLAVASPVRTITRAIVPNDSCGEVVAERNFLTTDREVWLRFEYAGANRGDNIRVEWMNPAGELYHATDYTHVGGQETWCSVRGIYIASALAASLPGQWSVRVLAANQLVFTENFEIAVPPPSPVVIQTAGVLPQGTVGQGYAYTITASGGTPPYRWAIAGGALPPGMNLDPSGRLGGTPNSVGSARVVIRVTDAAGNTLTRAHGIGIASPDATFNVRALSFTQVRGAAPPPAQNVIASSTGAPIRISATAESETNWLSVNPASGTTPLTIAVSVNGRNLAAGRYEGFVVIDGPTEPSLPVTLIVEEPLQPGQVRALISTIAGNDWIFPASGRGDAAPVGDDAKVAADRDGNLLLVDADNHVVIRWRPSNGNFEVVAGNGFADFSGDGGPAREASLDGPGGIAVDGSGNIYISDTFNHRIRRVSPDGIINTIAGDGNDDEFKGDGGSAFNASLDRPRVLAVDDQNNIYVFDSGNGRIRRITSNGNISTIAGNGSGASPGSGPATQTPLGFINALAVSPGGELFLATSDDNRIRALRSGQLIVVAGDGEERSAGDGGPASAASFDAPRGIAFDTAGNLYVAETNGYRVRRIDRSGVVTTIAGSEYGYSGDGGTAAQAKLSFPESIAADAFGNLYVFDSGALNVRRIEANMAISTVLGNGLFRATQDNTRAVNSFLHEPIAVTFDGNGNLYIAEFAGHRIKRVSPSGSIATVAGTGAAGFGGNGRPATSAPLDRPSGIAVDSAGNIFFSEYGNDGIRRIDPQGIITRIAGTGSGFEGDGGPALDASFFSPRGLAIDRQGNIFVADEDNNRVRRISPAGVVTTVAGDGRAEFAGDGAQATRASLKYPHAVAIDAQGNLYIADTYNHRIRRVTPAGVISTFAGNGRSDSAGDGGPAATAGLPYPVSLAFDSAGNLYVSELVDGHVRRIDAVSGTISTIAGNGGFGLSGDGGLAIHATFRTPTGLAVDRNGHLYIADLENHRIRQVLTGTGVRPTLRSSAASINFDPTASLVSQLRLSSSFAGLSFAASVQTASGGDWLSVSDRNGNLPAELTVTASRAALEPGRYQGTIVITAPNADPAEIRVPVTLTVASGGTARLVVEDKRVSLSFHEGAAPASSQITLSNPSNTPISFSASTEGGAWLSVSPSSGAVSSAAPGRLSITVDPATLKAGTYTGTVAIAGGAQTTQIPVYVSVSTRQRVVLLSQTGLTFRAIQGGGAALPHTISILNTGDGSMDWTASASTLSGGNWLRVGQANGTVRTAFTDASSLDVAVDTGGLTAGEYYGRVDVRAPGADNSPQTITILLQVLPPGVAIGPEVRPTGVVFVGAAGSNPGSQRVMIANTGSQSMGYGAVSQTVDRGSWFSHAPARATINPQQPAQIVIQPNLRDLTPGIRNGAVHLLFDDGSTADIKVTTVVPPAGSLDGRGGVNRAGGCNPRELQLASTNFTQSISASVGQPTPLEVQVFDNCGEPLTRNRRGAGVKMTFTNVDESFSMDALANGKWSKTWRPKSATPAGTRMTGYVAAFVIGPNNQVLANQFPVTVEVRAGVSIPRIAADGILNAASSASSTADAPVAPGMLVSIRGDNLADGERQAGGPQLPLELGGTEVRLGDQPLPLTYVGNGQVNAQIPYDLPPNTKHQLLIRRGSAVSVPEALTVAPAWPAIFSVNQQGTGQGVINKATGELADSASPAKAGDVVSIYCTGLGRVNPEVDDGAPPSADPISRTVNPVTVTIGGRPAEVKTSVLVPGRPGVYQVDAVVPEGIAAGDTVPVTVGITGQISPAVTIAVR